MPGLVYINKDSVSYLITDKVIKSLSSKIYGSLEYENLATKFNKAKLEISFSHFVLYDAAGNIFFDATNPKILWSLENLFKPGQIFSAIKAEKVSAFISRDSLGLWNFKKLLKTKSKQTNIRIDELGIPDLSVSIRDDLNDNNVDHSNLNLYFKKKNFKKSYIIKLKTPLGSSVQQSKSELLPSGLKNLAKLYDENYIDIDGTLNLADSKSFFGSDRLKFKIFNLDLININLIASLIDSNFFNRLTVFISKYANSDSTLNSIFEYKSKASNDNLLFRSLLIDFAKIPEINLDAHIKLGDDIQVHKAEISFLNSALELTGDIKAWLSNNPKFNTKFKLGKIDFYDLRSRFSELVPYLPDITLGLLSNVHDKQTVDGNVAITADSNTIVIDTSLDIENRYSRSNAVKQQILTTASGNYKKLNIEKFILPLDFSTANLDGFLDLENFGFNLHFYTNDLPLRKIKPFIKYAPNLNEYNELIEKTFVTGYTSTDVNLIKSSKEKNAFLVGDVKIAELNLESDVFPVVVKDLNADLELFEEELVVQSLKANLSEDYFEAQGRFKLNKSKQFSLKLASPKIKLDNINAFANTNGVLAINNMHFSDFKGNLEDVLIEIPDSQNFLESAMFDLKLDQIGFSINRASPFNNISGAVDIDQDTIRLIDLSSFKGDDQAFLFNGFIDRKTKSPKLSLKASSVSSEIFNSFSGLVSQFEDLSFKSGLVTCDLTLNGEQLIGKLDVDNLDLLVHHESVRYPIIDLDSELVIEEKNFTAKHLDAQYGSSSVDIDDLVIKNYKSEDRHIDLNAALKIAFGELKYIMPGFITEVIDAKGILPIDLQVKGNKLKYDIDLESKVSDAEMFKFSHWLVIDKDNEASLKSKLKITPQLIYSKDSQIIFKDTSNSLFDKKLSLEEQVALGHAVVVNSSYRVNDWEDKNKLNYDIFFNTNDELETKAQVGLIIPSVQSMAPLNLHATTGSFNCDNHGTLRSRQTACHFDFDSAVAKKYGIGDLSAKRIKAELLNYYYAPLYLKLKLFDGDWNGIDYKQGIADLKFVGNNLYVNNIDAKLAEGGIQGSTTFNFKTLESGFDLVGSSVSANQLVDGIWGLGSEVPQGHVSGTFVGKTKGIMPDDMFFNLVGETNLIVKKGKLSALTTMQKILTAVNTLKNFDFNNVFQTLITYKGGLFDYLITSLRYDKGKISTDKVLLKAEQIELNSKGFIDYAKDQLWIEGEGMIPKTSKSFFDKVGIGKASLGTLLSIANLNFNKEELRFFEYKMVGPVYDTEKSIESLKSNFKWVEEEKELEN